MGEVHRAYDTLLHRTVAIKLLHDSTAAESRGRLLREARAASSLTHPHICTIHSVEQADGHTFIVMEHVPGRPLSALDATGLSADQVRRIGAQIADAIGHAHSQGVVHRDLKSANVMITPEGQVKVLDFGIAARMPSEELASLTRTSLTDHGALAGTLAYMAPERFRGEAADACADIWALGVILYELAAGRLPFAGGTPFEVSSAVLEKPVPPLPTSVPSGLSRVIGRCLAKDPAERYQSAVEVRAALDATVVVQTEPAPTARTSRFRRLWLPLTAALMLVALLIGFALTREGSPIPTAASGTLGSVAILPLEDLSRDPDQSYFSAGMTEALITSVSQVSGLRVVPRSAVIGYAGTRKPLADITRELGVDAIVEGTVLRVGDRVRITAHLVHSASNRELWAGSYDRDLREVLALQSEVALAVANELRVTLTTDERARLAQRARPLNPAAYDYYLRGLAHVNLGTVGGHKMAIELLERAVALDRGFADAWGLLASAIAMYGDFAPEEQSRLEARARTAIDHALSLDDATADAYHARGRLVWTPAYGWRHEQAIEDYRRAIELKPNLDLAHHSLAMVYNHIGLLEESLAELRHAEQAPTTLFHTGLVLQIQGKHEQALATWLAIADRGLSPTRVAHIAWALLDLGRVDEALSTTRQFSATNAPDPSGALSAVQALLYAATGRPREATELIAQATATLHHDSVEFHHTTYFLASAYARMGNAVEALRWLQYTAANGFPCYPLMARDHSLDGLRSNVQFVEFLNELKGRWERYKTRFSARPS